jgi:glucokinase
MILAGDIGGTNVRLAVCERDGDGIRIIAEESRPSRSLATFEDGLAAFLAAQRRAPLHAACFGVAGAVIDGRCHTTNLPWVLEETALSKTLNGAPVRLLNDVVVTAYGMLHVPASDLVALHPKAVPQRRGNIAVVAVGTGLGEGILYWDGAAYHPLASEGGHSDFAPRTEQEIEVLRYLCAQLGGHVSYERVLSGPGLSNLYDFLRDSGFAAESPALQRRLQEGDRNEAITEIGLAGAEPLCVAAVDLFCSILGAEAGNLALKCLALGGVYIAGGIPPRLLPVLRSDRFWQPFVDKGRFKELLQRLPVWVNVKPGTPLLGAAHYALRLAGQ